MNKNISSKSLGSIGAIIFFLLVAGGYFWLWSSARPAAITDAAVDQKYKKVEITSLQSQAQSLISDKQNNGDLPVKLPAADQIGRDNPFSK